MTQSPQPPLSAEAYQSELKLPDALFADLQTYVAILEKWQRRINLVSSTTLADVWRRHVLDSSQIYPLIPSSAKTLIDLGSGAGFPGLILAMFSKAYQGPQVHLIEADSRKAAFLSEVNRQTRAGATIHARRIESVIDQTADVVTARALAPLPKLLSLAARFDNGDTTYIFLKGEKAVDELTEAEKEWTMNVEKTPSLSHAAGTILTLRGVKNRE